MKDNGGKELLVLSTYQLDDHMWSYLKDDAGHSDIPTTMTYDHPDQAESRSEVERISISAAFQASAATS